MKQVLTIAVAATSRARFAELSNLLEDLPVRLVAHDELTTGAVSLRQDGDTLESNAVNRARAVAASCRFLVLADESGLEVDALAGQPGVRSATYAHGLATDAENNAALLRDMDEFSPDDRTARFRCVLALVGLDIEQPITAEGVCEGSIARGAGNTSGTGYEPLFCVREAGGRPMSELAAEERATLSHTAHAARAFRPKLVRYLNRVLDEVEQIVS